MIPPILHCVPSCNTAPNTVAGCTLPSMYSYAFETDRCWALGCLTPINKLFCFTISGREYCPIGLCVKHHLTICRPNG